MTGKTFIAAGLALAIISSCRMENPLLKESSAPFGAPEFDKIRTEHYLPAFEAGIAEAKAEIDAIVADPAEPTFENTIEKMEFSGKLLDKVSGIFYNLMEADTDDQMQAVAEQVSPMLTEYSMYVSLNKGLFERVKAVYEKKDELGLDRDQMILLEDAYKSFSRGGANLSDEDKELYSKWSEELSLATLQFSRNVLAATNAYVMHITDSAELAGLPMYVQVMAAEAAKERGLEGWAFTLEYPSFGPFMKFSSVRERREEMWKAYNTRALGGEYDNSDIVKKIVDLRIKIAGILGYETYADYALEVRMAKDKKTVTDFIANLLKPSLPYAKADVDAVYKYAVKNGFKDKAIMPWDFSYW